ncbi:MAG: ABC transporter permease [Candidatus Omnitrophica bacterium]|nr:ABC transporter permease [Candidatus Omnitrophota bacterium]
MPLATQTSQTPHIRIEPSKSLFSFHWKDLWEYRELLYFLVWRDIKVRYKQTYLGAAWALLQPFLAMVLFSVFFGRLAKMPSDGIPYPIFAYTALLPWQLFAYSLSQSSNSLVSNQQLITKVYFPRLFIPLSSSISGLVDFAIAFSILLIMMFVYGIAPTGAIVTLPLFILFAAAAATSVGLWLSILNVTYRDVRYTLPFLTQIWFIASPVVYPASLVPETWRAFYALNPMVGVIEGFRWALLGAAKTPDLTVGISASVVIFLLVSGILYFKRMERTFADII